MSTLGVDIVDISRLSEAMIERIKKRVFSQNEIAQMDGLKNLRRKTEFFAGHFAAKEAFFKAIGSGIFQTHLSEVEVVYDPQGKPELRISEALRSKYLEGVCDVLLSISHDGNYAVAVVFLEK